MSTELRITNSEKQVIDDSTKPNSDNQSYHLAGDPQATTPDSISKANDRM